MLLLASASPRRRELLAARGLAFAIEPAEVDETLALPCEPEEAARLIARRKAEAVLARHRGEQAWILAADTVVALAGPAQGSGPRAWRLLGKPSDARDAAAMLRMLSDTAHHVVTGICAARATDGRLAVDSETTIVRMRRIEPAEIDAYVASGEWRGKAGGYAIQETADRFVVSLSGGGFDNVVGLPVDRSLALLATLGHGPRGAVADGVASG